MSQQSAGEIKTREFERELLTRIGPVAYSARMERKRAAIRSLNLKHNAIWKLKRAIRSAEWTMLEARLKGAKSEPDAA